MLYSFCCCFNAKTTLRKPYHFHLIILFSIFLTMVAQKSKPNCLITKMWECIEFIGSTIWYFQARCATP